jgi:hypothetical protein
MTEKQYTEYEEVAYTFTVEFNEKEKSLEFYIDDYSRNDMIKGLNSFGRERPDRMQSIIYFSPEMGGTDQLTDIQQGQGTVMTDQFRMYFWNHSDSDDNIVSFNFNERAQEAYLDMEGSGRDRLVSFLQGLSIPSVTSVTVGDSSHLLDEPLDRRDGGNPTPYQPIRKVTFFMLERPE